MPPSRPSGRTLSPGGGCEGAGLEGGPDQTGKEVVDDVAGGIGGSTAGEVGNLAKVVAAGEEGLLDLGVVADLPVADVGHEGVAQALAADGLAEVAPLLDEGVHRFGGAAVAEAAPLHAIGV